VAVIRNSANFYKIEKLPRQETVLLFDDVTAASDARLARLDMDVVDLRVVGPVKDEVLELSLDVSLRGVSPLRVWCALLWVGVGGEEATESGSTRSLVSILVIGESTSENIYSK